MSTQRVEVPKVVEEKLRHVRRRRATMRLIEAVTIPLTILLAGMLAMMALDWTLEIHRGWRLLTTGVALVAVTAAAVWGVSRLLALGRRLSISATEVDRAVPTLGERWSTITELSESNDPPAMKG